MRMPKIIRFLRMAKYYTTEISIYEFYNRLFRMIKIIKEREKLLKYISDIFKLNASI